MRTLKVVVFGGGTAMPAILRALLLAADILGIQIFIDAVCSPCDNGGGTGDLREKWGIGPVGDVSRVLFALSEDPYRDVLVERLSRRLDIRPRSGGSAHLGERHFGQSIMNLIFGGGAYLGGDMRRLVREMERVFLVRRGQAHLASWQSNVHLNVRLKNNEIIRGEKNVDIRTAYCGVPIKEAFLSPADVMASPEVLAAIAAADLLIWSPGDFWSSLKPPFSIPGVSSGWKTASAKTLGYINLMTKRDETDDWAARRFVQEIEDTIGRQLDYVSVSPLNDLPSAVIECYAAEGAHAVLNDLPSAEYWGGRRLLVGRLHHFNAERGSLRHDQESVARALLPILRSLQV